MHQHIFYTALCLLVSPRLKYVDDWRPTKYSFVPGECKKGKGMYFFITLYSVRWTAHSALHFTPWQTCSLWHQIGYSWKHCNQAAITREDLFFIWFPFCRREAGLVVTPLYGYFCNFPPLVPVVVGLFSALVFLLCLSQSDLSSFIPTMCPAHFIRILTSLPTIPALVPTSSLRSSILLLSALLAPAILLIQLFSHRPTCSLRCCSTIRINVFKPYVLAHTSIAVYR